MQNKINEKQQKSLIFERTDRKERISTFCSRNMQCRWFQIHVHRAQLSGEIEKQGLIQKDPSKPRALKVINNKKNSKTDEPKNIYSGKELVEVPIIGKVTAGQPILAVENIEDTFPLPLDFVQIQRFSCSASRVTA